MPLPAGDELRVLPLSDVEGLKKALADGELVKVDCRAFVAEQSKTLNMRRLGEMDHLANGHRVVWFQPGAWLPSFSMVPSKRSLREIVAELPRAFEQAERYRHYGKIGQDTYSLLDWVWQFVWFFYMLVSGVMNTFLRSYAVVNLAELTLNGLCERVEIPLTSAWRRVHNFVWIGPGPGGLHYDEMDNVLIQVEGHKHVLCFPPECTDFICGKHYPASFEEWMVRSLRPPRPPSSPPLERDGAVVGSRSERSRECWRRRAQFPMSRQNLSKSDAYREKHGRYVMLGPGDGLLIPSGACERAGHPRVWRASAQTARVLAVGLAIGLRAPQRLSGTTSVTTALGP